MIYAITDTWYIVLRDLRTRMRMPVFIFMTMFQPILWMGIFPQIFKSVDVSAVSGPGADLSYLEFFAPGVVIMTVLFGSAFSGFGTLMDIDAGIISKMLATPVTRASIITGRVIATVMVGMIQACTIIIVATIMGVHVETGVPGVFLVLFLAALLGMGFAAFSNGLALLLRRQETVMAVVNLFTMPLMFLSTMWMTSEQLPDWLNTARQFNPVDYAINGARHLFLDGYIWSDLWKSLVVLGAWAIIGVIFGTLMFRRRAE
ncbi:ABC transporter permease [Chloroflexota bacterium]